jgi:hypothetical protein
MTYSRHEYESEPVHYCKNCLSLSIKAVSEIDLDICGECGNAEIEEASAEDWNKLYTDRYGVAFMDINSEYYPDYSDEEDAIEDDY